MIIPELLAGIATDLHQITNHLAWAHTQAWWPTSRPLDAPTGRPLPPPADTGDPDHIPGPRYATGLGDHRTAEAIRTATRHLAKVEAELDDAVLVTMTAGGCPHTARPVRYGNRPDRLARMLPALRWRVVTLGTSQPIDGEPKKHLHRHLTTARREIDRAWRTLDAALTRGAADPADQAVAARDLCVICRIRPRALKKGKRCETCARFKARAGYERPRKLDAVHDARDAQARRTARGEGFGDESFAATSLPPLHDCRCTPDKRCPNHLTGRAGPAPGCGTPAGYVAHQRAEEPACQACREAWEDSRARLAAQLRARGLEAS